MQIIENNTIIIMAFRIEFFIHWIVLIFILFDISKYFLTENYSTKIKLSVKIITPRSCKIPVRSCQIKSGKPWKSHEN